MIVFIVCLSASIIGAICGIGGGIIIKPVLDSIGIIDIMSLNFLSGCTVLSMTAYSVLKERLSGNSLVEGKKGVSLSIGAAIGGLIGKHLFSHISTFYPNRNEIGAFQAFCLILITLGTLFYMLFKDKIRTKHIKNVISIATLGGILGITSSFLGIGGGPINLVVLFYFFSMSTKTAAEYSLFIILFSQFTTLLTYILTCTVPNFQPHILVLMVSGGILGGIIGRKINQIISHSTVNKLFIGLMLLIILINVYNIYKYLWK